jgi:hypothetical protein
VQRPVGQVVFDLLDDHLVGGGAGEGPAANRDPLGGDGHAEDDLRQIGPVVLAVPGEPAGRLLVRDVPVRGLALGLLLAQRGGQLRELIGDIDLEVGG